MSHKERAFCPALWLSGFFGLGAAAHLVRLFLRFSLEVGGHEISFAISEGVVVLLGALSIGLLILGIKSPCDSREDGVSSDDGCCRHSKNA